MSEFIPTFDDIKALQLSEVSRYGDNLRARALKGSTKSQREAWPLKGVVALNIIKGTASDAEIATVQAELDTRSKDETVQELAQKQYESALSLLTFNNSIEGTAKYSADLINAASTEAELDDALASIKERRTALESSLPK